MRRQRNSLDRRPPRLHARFALGPWFCGSSKRGNGPAKSFGAVRRIRLARGHAQRDLSISPTQRLSGYVELDRGGIQGMATRPEADARAKIDRLLSSAGWDVQDVSQANIHAARGVALRVSSRPWMRSLPFVCESTDSRGLIAALQHARCGDLTPPSRQPHFGPIQFHR